jgi:signal transduction histidine kinase
MISPDHGSIPPLPSPTEVDSPLLAEDASAQALFQENQSLRQAIARHSQLMQLLTHQIATPLTTLSGSVDLLADLALEPHYRQEFLTVVHQQVQRLHGLLQDFLALRNLEANSLIPQPVRFDLPTLVEEVMANFAPYPVAYRFAAELPQVWGDRWQISQVLVNLISNAIKYSPGGEAIEVGAMPLPNGCVEVWVRDQGLGIPEADQPHLFENFYRVNHCDRQTIDGTGLGLSLCKLLVENQGGQIGFTSTHGSGSRFCFSLPSVALADR